MTKCLPDVSDFFPKDVDWSAPGMGKSGVVKLLPQRQLDTIGLKKCQKTSKNVKNTEKHQKTPKKHQKHQKTSKNIKKHQKTSTKHQKTLTNVNC